MHSINDKLFFVTVCRLFYCSLARKHTIDNDKAY